MQPPSNIVDIYKSQGWNDMAAIQGDINEGNWKNKVPSGGASGSSGANLDISSIPSSLEFAKTNEAPIDSTMAEYAMTARGQEKPLDIYTKLSESAGLPTLRKTASTLQGQIANLEDTIKGVEPMVEGTTRNSLVTAAQRARMISAGQKEPLKALAETSTALGRVSQGIQAGEANIGTITGLAMQGQERELEPLKLKLSVLSDRAARLMTGFTSDSQNKLQVLIANWNRNNELSDKETDRAFELLKMEKNYQNEYDKMVKESELSISGYQKKSDIDAAAKKIADVTTPVNVNPYYSTPVTNSYYGSGGVGTIQNLWG